MGRPARLLVEIVGDSRGLGRAVGDADSKLGRLGGAARAAGRAAAVGIGAGAAALGALAVSSVKSASALEQSTGAVESVFGKAAGAVKRFAADAADNVGLAKSQYQDLAAVVGSQMIRFGQSQSEAAASTDRLITLGADLAATYGGTVSEAVQAVSSLLRGERDPIERYAVGINQAAVESELAAQGLGNLEGKARTQAEAQATLALLFEQTTAAQGSFARESDTLAGTQERLKAKFENVKAELGERLLPIATRFGMWILDSGIPAVRQLASWLADNLGPSVSKVADWVRDRLVPAVQRMYEWFVDKVVPALRDTVGPVIDSARRSFQRITGAVGDNKDELGTLAEFISEVAIPVIKTIARIVGTSWKAQFDVGSRVIAGIIDTIGALVRAIEKAIDAARRLGSAVKNAVTSNPFDFDFDFGFSAGGLHRMTPGALGGGPGYGGLSDLATAGLATAAAGAYSGSSHRTRAGGGLTYVDNREITVRVDGALDPVAVAAQIEGILKAHTVRTGRQLTYGAA